MKKSAVVLTNGLFDTAFAKTAHGLVRGPSRYRLLGIIDGPGSTGGERDAGEMLDGRRRTIPMFASLASALERLAEKPDYCVVGVATVGGVLPPEVRGDLLAAVEDGISLVNGLHQLLADDDELASTARRTGAELIDLRRTRPVKELRFWSGQVLQVATPRVAVIGTDCAIGKRTTAGLLLQALRDRGTRTELVYTGQTGWLQGFPHGFILDATPNDFVSGELERAILDCQQETDPELILLEGQAALRHPAGPCGSELILSGGAAGVILQHAPGRQFFEDLDAEGCESPALAEEILLIRLLGADVWAVSLNTAGLQPGQASEIQRQLSEELGLPIVLPLNDDAAELAKVVTARIAGRPE